MKHPRDVWIEVLDDTGATVNSADAETFLFANPDDIELRAALWQIVRGELQAFRIGGGAQPLQTMRILESEARS